VEKEKNIKAEWADFHKKVMSRQCSNCKSNKVTTYSRGRPLQAWVEYHQWATETLGFKTHVFGSCTEELTATSRCTECHSTDVLL